MTFHVGQKVECINDCNGGANDDYGAGYSNGLRKGAVYTVTRVGTFEGREAIDVWGIQSGDENGPAWFADRFRPITEQKLPAELTALLDNKNHKPLPEDIAPRRKVSADICGND